MALGSIVGCIKAARPPGLHVGNPLLVEGRAVQRKDVDAHVHPSLSL